MSDSLITRHHLLPVFQSAYRPHHSTETALARIMNDMILVVDDGRVGALTLLDLSAAFDTVDHSVLTNVMRKRFMGGAAGTAGTAAAVPLLREVRQDKVLPYHFSKKITNISVI